MANSYQTLVFDLWDVALVSQTILCVLGTHIFYCSSLFPKERNSGMCRNARAEHVCWGAERHIFALSACGNICMETGAFGDGNHPDWSRSRWDTQPEPACLVYALLIRHVIRVIYVFFPFLLSKPVLLLRCLQRLWWGAQFESLRVTWQHLFMWSVLAP